MPLTKCHTFGTHKSEEKEENNYSKVKIKDQRLIIIECEHDFVPDQLGQVGHQLDICHLLLDSKFSLDS